MSGARKAGPIAPGGPSEKPRAPAPRPRAAGRQDERGPASKIVVEGAALPIRKPSILFNLARFLARRNIRGGWRLWLHLIDSGALDQVARYELQGPARAAPLLVPLYRRESSWSEAEVAEYEWKVVRAVIERLSASSRDFALIDCGADIGLVASALARGSERVKSVVAYEPNREAFALLEASLNCWPIEARAVPAGVGERAMRARLVEVEGNASAHARYLVEDPDGPIEVRRVDDEPVPAHLGVVLKVDVEGLELAVVRGALETLRRAPEFVVTFEAHPKVVRRTGVDPCAVIQLIASTAPIDVAIAELPGVAIDPQAPFFSQLGAASEQICNVVCMRKPRPLAVSTRDQPQSGDGREASGA
ncbi:MAG: FkbM family methyltransferase [Parvularculaceae bacterium]|nr:FkbM family methyltransferase [Parvularculaceae bacterium]